MITPDVVIAGSPTAYGHKHLAGAKASLDRQPMSLSCFKPVVGEVRSSYKGSNAPYKLHAHGQCDACPLGNDAVAFISTHKHPAAKGLAANKAADAPSLESVLAVDCYRRTSSTPFAAPEVQACTCHKQRSKCPSHRRTKHSSSNGSSVQLKAMFRAAGQVFMEWLGLGESRPAPACASPAAAMHR